MGSAREPMVKLRYRSSRHKLAVFLDLLIQVVDMSDS